MDKFYRAIKTLKADANYSYEGDIVSTEDQFNKVKWISNGDKANEETVYGDRPIELTWVAVKEQMDKL
jgi:hypothetical protein